MKVTVILPKVTLQVKKDDTPRDIVYKAWLVLGDKGLGELSTASTIIKPKKK